MTIQLVMRFETTEKRACHKLVSIRKAKTAPCRSTSGHSFTAHVPPYRADPSNHDEWTNLSAKRILNPDRLMHAPAIYILRQFNFGNGRTMSSQANSCSGSTFGMFRLAFTGATDNMSNRGSSACPRYTVGATFFFSMKTQFICKL
jgi:hypothetical protein